MSLSSEMMGERRVVKGGEGQTPASEPENLQCPRCESTNTKFCYYNNYNLSQPRYFCKGCRRYWTRGGSLRNIPVGGGSRKNSKRSRSSSATSQQQQQQQQPVAVVACNSAPPNDSPANHSDITPVSFCIKTENTNPNPNPNPNPVSALSPFRCSYMNLNEALPGSFSSLLGSQQTGGFLGLSGYSLGLGPGSSSGFDMLGFGFGKSAGEWPMVEIGGENVNGNGSGGSGGSSSGCNTWQMDGVDGTTTSLTDAGDCFGWPDLAISTPGTAGLD